MVTRPPHAEAARAPHPDAAAPGTKPQGSIITQAAEGLSAIEAVPNAAITVLEAFRRACLVAGYAEQHRRPVVSRHDPSVRYTNSTISVLKPLLSGDVHERAFLVQPALRLRNLDHVRRTGEMSPFGCSFMSFGALGPSRDAARLTALARDLLVDRLGFAAHDVQLRVLADDRDLLECGIEAGLAVATTVRSPEEFRHVFGMPGVTGRNANIALRGARGWTDVANVIVIEEAGRPIGVELAFGVNMVLVQAMSLAHPVLAGPATAAVLHGVTDLMALDALSSATVLAMEGVRPVARGRGQNYRSLLRLLGERTAGPAEVWKPAALAVAAAEERLRRHASPPADDVDELPSEQAAHMLEADWERVC
ncbi:MULTISPECIES: hypothetical protein [unclassified Streptomyces]|uniref:hypothetical protein n=1 Tax=unclassified Streptomyces TaxID=2593676 RepID=UPI002DD97D90|nr:MULTISPECIES: hypothetical protein [unclassified Streptomyces]WSF85980.1 hypothetical protein OIE70_24500 [Streptomyces sp. NBC_01744]WSC37735.1 hypothetical protein OHA08_20705 [Streptomyces sp. NBC_01763]WSC45849.1 hypothetical protein OIE61_18835 [Streptomyces sp. NBC_01762]WSC55144.1 hypothetical protein OG808_24410 [Streptomyces sp. NBC_01761]WSJ52535.1 hypothetical protein OG243_25060 [Streptomyces sp. NBC_01318]